MDEVEVIFYMIMAFIFQVLGLLGHKEKDVLVGMVFFGLGCLLMAILEAFGINVSL